MSAPGLSTIRYAKARLIANPTTTAGDPPYGGTYLGLARDIVCTVTEREYLVRYEEYGSIPGRVLRGVDEAKVECLMRGADADALAAVFGSSVSSSVGTPISYVEDSSVQRIALLVMPLDPADDAFYLPRAVGGTGTMRTPFTRYREWTYPGMWTGLPDASGRVWLMDPLEDITL